MLSISVQDLTSFNTLGLRSCAAALLRYDSPAQLAELSGVAKRYRRVFVLGGGSNVVMAPQIDPLIIKVESRGIRLVAQNDRELIVEAQAGEPWHEFVRLCVANGWYGLENLALIPGTVGAAPAQNIGAYGVELDQRFHSLSAWDLHAGEKVEMDRDDCRFSYRDSLFKRAESGRWLILAVRFRLPLPWMPVLTYADLKHSELGRSAESVSAVQIFDAVCRIRRHKLPDPAVLGNAGSFFKNPVVSAQRYQVIKAVHADVVAYPQDHGQYKLAAGWLIDRAGWKGRRIGPVGVHKRQALVLVNYGGATADDIASLAGAIKKDVAARFGVRLEQEPVAV